MDRIWHPLLVRFGANTLKTFKQRSDGDPHLGEEDIFFIDMGVVWQGHEGDAGATFTTGSDPQMIARAAAAKDLFDRSKAFGAASGCPAWRFMTMPPLRQRPWAGGSIWTSRVTGSAIFPCDLPGGDLGDLDQCPNTGLWILEIQIAHPERPFGAFYEDLLI
jgi:hypothetical protein